MDLTDTQWQVVKDLFPGPERRRPGPQGGRPWRDPRDVLNGVLWILRTGAGWADLPSRYPPFQTCHRRFQTWVKKGIIDRFMAVLGKDLLDRGKLDLTECHIDGTHAGAKKKELRLGALAGEWPPRSWQWQTAMAFLSPPGLRAVSAMSRSSSKQQLKRERPQKSRSG